MVSTHLNTEDHGMVGVVPAVELVLAGLAGADRPPGHDHVAVGEAAVELSPPAVFPAVCLVLQSPEHHLVTARPSLQLLTI